MSVWFEISSLRQVRITSSNYHRRRKPIDNMKCRTIVLNILHLTLLRAQVTRVSNNVKKNEYMIKEKY